MSVLEYLGVTKKDRERRQHERTSAHTIKLKFGGATYPSLDWSLGGCRISGIPDRLRRGDLIEGTLAGIGFAHSGEFLAEIVWRKDDGLAGLRWLELEPHVFQRLTRLRGQVG
jgi:hypothetical protein